MKRFVLFVALLGIAGGIVSFLIVDWQVQRDLKRITTEGVPALYGRPIFLNDRTAWSKEGLRQELLSRKYEMAAGPVDRPGQFKEAPGGFQIYSRQFLSPEGNQIVASKLRVTFAPWSVVVESGNGPAALEPTFLRYLVQGEGRTSSRVALADFPAQVKNAVIAIEDERFYSHFGIDPIGIIRALVRNLTAGKLIEGGSTLTQQLAKNVFLSPERTIKRKVIEVLAAISIERHLSKDQVLELYLNEVYLGQDGSLAIHGMPNAARYFFGRSVQELTVAQAATLAGIIQAPSYYSPTRHADRAKDRRDIVLARMREQGMISDKVYASAIPLPLTVANRERSATEAPHFVNAVTERAKRFIQLDSIRQTNVQFITSLDGSMQSCGEKAVEEGLAALETRRKALRRSPRLEGALFAIEPGTGEVRAWIGSRDYTRNQYDHVSQARRQIGSLIKPFLYLAALDPTLNNYKTATVLSILPDTPKTISLPTGQVWRPENYDHEYRGDVTLRYALEHSLNLPAVYVAERIRPASLTAVLDRFNIKGAKGVPALALGTHESSLMEMVSGYAALAAQGIYTEPRLILSIQDGESGSVLGGDPLENREIGNAGPIAVLVNIMQGVVTRGTAKQITAAGYRRPAAGKTGTSNNTRDSWFIGFTPNLAVGVWVGFDDQAETGLTGATGAVPIWLSFMKCVEPLHPSAPFLFPANVEVVRINPRTYRRVTSACPSEPYVEEVFVSGTEPRRSCEDGEAESDSSLVPAQPLPEQYRQDHPRVRPDYEPPVPPEPRRGLWDRIFG